MTSSTIQKLRLLALTVALSAASGAIYAVALRPAASGAFDEAAMGGVIGAVISSAIVGAGLFGAASPLTARIRRLPLAAAILLRTAAYGTVIVAALLLVPWLYSGVATLPLRPGVPGDILFSYAVTFTVASLVSIAQLIGPGTLIELLSGRYHRPREEERIVLFLDLVGSTTIAERIGNLRFHALLAETFTRLSQVVTDHGGEIHRYVGDALIATWPLRGPEDNGRPLRCLLACREALASAGGELERRHGALPGFRAGLHAGTVVAGEIGGFKREIALLGDAMNTAARVEAACRASGHDLLVSEALVARATLPPGLRLTGVGRRQLRGKAEALELFALERAEDGEAGNSAPPRAHRAR